MPMPASTPCPSAPHPPTLGGAAPCSPVPPPPPMLPDLKTLFSRTWSAFGEEAGRREPEDQVA